MLDSSKFTLRLSVLQLIKSEACDGRFYHRLLLDLDITNYIVDFANDDDSTYLRIKEVFGMNVLIPFNCYSPILYDSQFIKKINLKSRVGLFIRYY